MCDTTIQLDESCINHKLRNKEWKELEDILRIESTPDSSGKLNPKLGSPGNIDLIVKIISHTRSELLNALQNDLVMLTIQCYRTLRNVCSFSKDIQIYISCDTPVLKDSLILFDLFFDILKNDRDADVETCLLVLMQFLGNNVVQNFTTQNAVWHSFKTAISRSVELKIKIISNVAAMIAYNILESNPDLEVIDLKIFLTQLESAYCSDHPYPQLLFEHYIKHWDDKLSKVYKELPTEVRILVLETTREMVQSEQDLSETYLKFLSKEFKDNSDCILKTVASYVDKVKPEEVVSLLNVLALATSIQLYLHCFKDDKSLFINCAYLLKAMHSLGQDGDNNFSSIQRLADIAPGRAGVEIANHVAFGFKAQLVRTLGNLMDNNPTNQRELREMDGIPFVLDCCNIDARNPLIMQWAIFAIRNMCHNCPENQEIIVSMKDKGPAYSKIINELGLKN